MSPILCRSWVLSIFVSAVAAGCGGESAPASFVERDSGASDDQVARDAAADGGSTTQPSLLSTSATHSCAMRKAGLFCWGENFKGQLGTGDLVDSERAVAASVAGMDIVQVAVSTGRSCVRRSTGKVACWGANELGQIGDGTRDDSLVAVNAIGVDDAVQLALDDQTTCVVRGAARSVACWGGSPSDAPDTGSLEPVTIAGLSGVVELRAGVEGEYCGMVQDDSVRCWALEDGTWTAATEVRELAGAHSIAMAAPAEVCGIVGTGAVQCHNLDNGKTVPLDDSDGHVRVIGAGSLAACAVSTTGAWSCWNVLQPMLETVGSPRLEVRAQEATVDLVFSGFRVCALESNGEVACGMVEDWGPPMLIKVDGLPE
jgi:hypothetical protein